MTPTEVSSLAMKTTTISTLIFLFVTVGSFQVSRSEDLSTCMNTIINLSPCLDFITKTSDHPTPVCCGALGTILGSQPLCLCTILDGEVSAALGIDIDPSRALRLPPMCDLQTPPISLCNVPTMASPPPAVAPSKTTTPEKSKASSAVVSSASPPSSVFHFYFYFAVLAAAFIFWVSVDFQ